MQINPLKIPRIRIPFRGNWAVKDVRTLQSSTHPLLETSHAQHISPHAVLCPDLFCDQKIIPRVLVDVFFANGAQSFWVGFARIFIDQVP